MTMMKLNNLEHALRLHWESLEKDAASAGHALRRFEVENYEFWVGQFKPTRDFEFGIPYSGEASPSKFLAQLPSVHGLEYRIEALIDSRLMLWVVGRGSGSGDLFFQVTLDVLKRLHQNPTSDAVGIVVSRIVRWSKFFAKDRSALSIEAQLGLFGEVSTLLALLKVGGCNKERALTIWVGPDGAPQDFIGQDRLEVKSSRQNPLKVVTISSEWQLESSDRLHLILHSLKQAPPTSGSQGTTLPELINRVLEFLQDELALIGLFQTKLESAGYYDEDSNDYLWEYTHNFTMAYEVRGEFPRLTSLGLPAGLHSVKYDLDLAFCGDFKSNYDDVILNFSLGAV
jgi:Putative  PD-(D/E)XK family member, (DUF4420)